MRPEVRRAAELLREGELVVYPTDTLYGLGADATDPDAVDRVYWAKGRPRDDPVSVATSLDAVDRVADTGDHRDAVEALLPGPVTILLPARDGLAPPLARDGKVGIRVPDDPVALDLLELAPPVTATSANRSGDPPLRVPRGEFVREMDYVLDDGPRSGDPSTVYDAATGEVVREGALAPEEVRRRVAEAQDT